MVALTSDRIEKHIVLAAPRSRVWRAITSAEEFGKWFGVTLDGPFAENTPVSGRINTKGFEGLKFELMIERIEPQRYFSYRWHPYAVDPKVDYSAEPSTLVEFTFSEVAGGTALDIVESGFERIPLRRRAEAFRMNDGGWSEQIQNIERYVAT
jgi:uncharacterized protein YndB with AHSA1/START domain